MCVRTYCALNTLPEETTKATANRTYEREQWRRRWQHMCNPNGLLTAITAVSASAVATAITYVPTKRSKQNTRHSNKKHVEKKRRLVNVFLFFPRIWSISSVEAGES